jgi:hypothetical protein
MKSCNNIKNQIVTLAGYGKPYPAGDFEARKNDFEVLNKILRRQNLSFPFAKFLPICYYMTAGRTARELWWTNQEFSFVDVIPPCFYMFIYDLGDEEEGQW